MPPRWVPFTGCPRKLTPNYSPWNEYDIAPENRCSKKERILSQPSLPALLDCKFQSPRVPGHIRIKCPPCTHAVSSVAYLVLGTFGSGIGKVDFEQNCREKRKICGIPAMDICKHKATFLGSKSPYILYQTNGWNLLTSGAFGKSIFSNVLSCSKKRYFLRFQQFLSISQSVKLQSLSPFSICWCWLISELPVNCDVSITFKHLHQKFQVPKCRYWTFFGYFGGGFSIT